VAATISCSTWEHPVHVCRGRRDWAAWLSGGLLDLTAVPVEAKISLSHKRADHIGLMTEKTNSSSHRPIRRVVSAKTTTAINLAASLAMADQRVLLIEFSTRRPT